MLIMGYINKDGKRLKKRPMSCQPIMTSWGLGEGRPPLTDDPENPIRMFAEYEVDTEQDKERR